MGQISPEGREDTWHTSIRMPASTTDRVTVSFPEVEVRRDVYMSETKDFPMETLGSQKQEHVDSSDGSPKVFRPSFPLPTAI